MSPFKAISNNFFPKIVCLVLAVVTWFYVFDIVNSDPQKKETVEEVYARSTIIGKEVPVKLVFSGKTPVGYKVLYNKIVIKPSKIAIVGPDTIIDGIEELKTQRIYLGEYTRSVTLEVALEPTKNLKMEDNLITAIIPIEKNKE